MAMQVVGCNGALMGMLPWLFGAFLADFRAITWSWLQLPLAVAAILVHLIIAILQVWTATDINRFPWLPSRALSSQQKRSLLPCGCGQLPWLWSLNAALSPAHTCLYRSLLSSDEVPANALQAVHHHRMTGISVWRMVRMQRPYAMLLR